MQTFNIDKTDSKCIVTYCHFSYIALAMFIASLLFPLGCLGGAIFHDWQLWLMFFASLFPTGIFFAVFMGLWCWKGRLVLDETGLELLRTCFSIEDKKRFSLAEIRLFKLETYHGSKGKQSYRLRVVGQRNNTDFQVPGSASAIDDLCDKLNAFLRKLKTVDIPEEHRGIPEPIAFGLDSPPQHLEPPSKSRWHCQTNFEGFVFQKRGEDTMGDVIGGLVFSGFPLGIAIIIAFVNREELMVLGSIHIILSFFVLPGLFYGAMALNHVLELFRVTTWTFVLGEARFRTIRFVWAHAATYELGDWNSLVVRVPEAQRDNAKELELNCDPEKIRDYYDDEARWKVAFLSANGESLLAIEKLSKPEALWMADVVLREQRAIR